MGNEERMLSVNEAMEQAIYKRIEEIDTYKVISNSQYKAAHSKTDELIKQFSSTLTGEQQKAFNQIIDAISREESIAETILYRQGLRDGLALPKAWGGVM